MKACQRNKVNKSRKSIGFVANVAITYLALFALMMFVVSDDAAAGMSGKSSDTYNGHFETDFLTTLTVVGQGELSWLGFSIYHASLWTRDGKFQNLEETNPVALAITYQRNIDADDLAQKTVEEWERLGIFNVDERDSWGQRLKKIWPDVKAQDSITTLVTPDRKTRFYHNDKLLTVLEEPEFGNALLSIWLDPQTSEPGLRKKLIGKGEDE